MKLIWSFRICRTSPTSPSCPSFWEITNFFEKELDFSLNRNYY